MQGNARPSLTSSLKLLAATLDRRPIGQPTNPDGLTDELERPFTVTAITAMKPDNRPGQKVEFRIIVCLL